MKANVKNRRSSRVPGSHRLLFTIINSSGAEIMKEIVTAVELSQYGARVRGYRTVSADAQGLLTQLSSGRQAPIRVAWQRRADADPNFLDTGVELLSGFDFWGIVFADPALQPAPFSGPAKKAVRPQELLEEMKKLLPSDNPQSQILESIWCGLIEQLEARRVIAREDLVSALRGLVAEGAKTAQKNG